MKLLRGYTWILFLAIGSLIGASSPLFAIGLMLAPTPGQSYYQCNLLLTKVAASPNEWGFVCTWCPYLTEGSLTDGIIFGVQSPRFTTMTAEEAEKIYAKLCRQYITGLNEIKIVRPFLKEFPIDITQLFLHATFRTAAWKTLPPPTITGISLSSDLWVEYAQFSDVFGAHYPKVIKKRPHNVQALKNLFSIPVPRTNRPPEGKIPEKDPKIDKDAPIRQLIYKAGLAFSQKYHLRYLLDGWVEENGRSGYPYGYLFMGDQKMTLEEVRKMAADGAKKFFENLQKSKEVSEALATRNELRGEHNGPVAEPRHVSFRISFWDENINRVEEPYIAEIRVEKGSLRYFTADEGQRLVLVYKESFEDAMKLLSQ